MQGITNARGAPSAATRSFPGEERRELHRRAGSGGGRVLTKNIWLQLDEASLPPAGRGDGSPELRLRQPRNSECTRI